MGLWTERIVSRTSGPLRGPATEANTFAVTAVHPNSIAAEAGVASNWLYRPSRPKALSPLALPERAARGRVTSRFVDLATREEMEFVTEGFPFGVELAKSPLSLAADILGDTFDIDAVAALAHAGDRDQIGRFVAHVTETMQRRNRTLGDVVKGIFSRPAPAASAERDLDAANYMGLHPHAKLIGAFWLAVHRKPQAARQLLQAWEHWGVDASGDAYAALYLLTSALLRESEGAAGAQIRELIQEAHRRVGESPLIEALWRERSDDPLATRPTRVGRPFAPNYRLAVYDPLRPGDGRPGYQSLEEAVAALKPEQRLIVYLLGAYRANGFYARSLYRLQELYPLLGAAYPLVHVVTAFQPGGRHNPEWLSGELLARQKGADIRILHDPGDSLRSAVHVVRSPHAFILDRELIVRYDGALVDEAGFWQALGTAASTPSPEA